MVMAEISFWFEAQELAMAHPIVLILWYHLLLGRPHAAKHRPMALFIHRSRQVPTSFSGERQPSRELRRSGILGSCRERDAHRVRRSRDYDCPVTRSVFGAVRFAAAIVSVAPNMPAAGGLKDTSTVLDWLGARSPFPDT
jgi:hypothetical protein